MSLFQRFPVRPNQADLSPYLNRFGSYRVPRCGIPIFGDTQFFTAFIGFWILLIFFSLNPGRKNFNKNKGVLSEQQKKSAFLRGVSGK
jgi:hypothetical protein